MDELQQMAGYGLLAEDLPPVIARSPCDEAIQRAACAAVDCFAHRTALCAEPVARNDGLKIPHFIGASFGSL
jgi:hypothetical protein